MFCDDVSMMNDDVTERLLPLQSLILVSDRSSLYNLTSHTHNMLTVFIILIITLSCKASLQFKMHI